MEIRPALISSPDYMLKFGPVNCNVTECPYSSFIHAEAGGAHVVYITENNITIYTVIRPNTVSVLWQLPQFFCITIGEVLFSVTGLEFSYSQAPANMKSVLQVTFIASTTSMLKYFTSYMILNCIFFKCTMLTLIQCYIKKKKNS